MKYMKSTAAFIIGILLFSSGCSDDRVMLFNGENLDNWTFYSGEEVSDPSDVFWVEEGMIHTSGIPNGYIRTRETYSNFKLHVEWR